MSKKNTPTQYAPTIPQDASIQVSVAKVGTTVIASLIIGAIFGGFAVVRVADSTAIRLTFAEAGLSELKNSSVSRKEWEQQQVYLDLKFSEINTKIDKLPERIKE